MVMLQSCGPRCIERIYFLTTDCLVNMHEGE